jgi:hypothetical protein
MTPGNDAHENQDEGDENEGKEHDQRDIIERCTEYDNAQHPENEEHEAADRCGGSRAGVWRHGEGLSKQFAA